MTGVSHNEHLEVSRVRGVSTNARRREHRVGYVVLRLVVGGVRHRALCRFKEASSDGGSGSGGDV